MSKPDTRKITCTACQYENEIERVYCHSCGEKLDRSLIPVVDEVKESDNNEKTRQKVKKMMNPNRFAWVRVIKTLALTEIFAAIVAAGFLASQAPENTPPMKTDRTSADVKNVKEEWLGMMSARMSLPLTFSDFDINFYLRNALKGSAGSLGIKYDRTFVTLQPGLLNVASQRDAWGLRIYNSVGFKPTLTDGKWSADVQRVAIGRLTIPADLAKLAKMDNLVLDAVAKAFEKEIKQLDRVQKIEVGENVISFTTKPAQ